MGLFGGRVFQQTIDFSVGSNFAPMPADLFFSLIWVPLADFSSEAIVEKKQAQTLITKLQMFNKYGNFGYSLCRLQELTSYQ